MSRKAQRASCLSSDAASAHRTPEERWRALFGSEPPASATLVEQALAWQAQVLAGGDVSATVARDLAVAARQVRVARRAAPAVADAPVATPAFAERAMQSPLPLPVPSQVPSPRLPAPSAAPALPPASSQLLPGTRLVKTHGGRTHVVEVIAGGLRYDGAVYASLSAVAKAITGTHWNGLLFFGLRKRKVYPAKKAAHG